MTQNYRKHKIKEVLPGSIAEEMGVEPGDFLLAINEEEVEDVFDYRFITEEEEALEVLIEKPDKEQWLLDIEKEPKEDLGIVFENDLMSEYHSCCNKCVFCFIDQMPPHMRETLYFKDDDSRLSFLQGNYITLTNMKEKDIDRIVRFHLAPINISVHTTNPALRCKMLHNRFAGEVLRFIDRLYEHQIEMNGQIVLCKGVNDGAELKKTIEDLANYLPVMRSVSVVPAGITKYRKGLYPLELFQKEEAGEVIDCIEQYQKKFYEQHGLHFIHASDEFYLLAGRAFPEEERYDGYLQLENGVGMMRLLREEFTKSLQKRMSLSTFDEERKKRNRTLSIATGKLAYPLIKELAGQVMQQYPGMHIHIFCIQNNFFGETITVSGLITGQDLTEQMFEKKKQGVNLGSTLLISSNMLRMGEQVFLDDMTLGQVKERLEMEICPVDSNGEELLFAMLDEQYETGHARDKFVYIQAYADKEEP